MAALAVFLEVPRHEIEEEGYEEHLFTLGTWEYLVMTDEEATAKTAETIRETVWAYNASFLAEQTKLPEEIFEAVHANEKAESNNEAISRCIEATCGWDKFVKAAVSADGRGHVLSSYDGQEMEVLHWGTKLFVYRVN